MSGGKGLFGRHSVLEITLSDGSKCRTQKYVAGSVIVEFTSGTADGEI